MAYSASISRFFLFLICVCFSTRVFAGPIPVDRAENYLLVSKAVEPRANVVGILNQLDFSALILFLGVSRRCFQFQRRISKVQKVLYEKWGASRDETSPIL